MSEDILEFQIGAPQVDETAATMEMTFDEAVQLIRAEHNDRLEQLLADFERLLAQRLPGQAVRVSSAFDISKISSPLRLYVIISLHAEAHAPQPTPTPALPAPMPQFTGMVWMAERTFRDARLFYWQETKAKPGTIWVLWTGGKEAGTWHSLADASPSNISGFDWVAGNVPLGPALTSEIRGEGCVELRGDVLWIKAPSDGAIFALLAEGAWIGG